MNGREPIIDRTVLDTDGVPVDESRATESEALVDRDGNPVAGIGRLDQVIGGVAAKKLFEDRENTIRALRERAEMRWGVRSGKVLSYAARAKNLKRIK